MNCYNLISVSKSTKSLEPAIFMAMFTLTSSISIDNNQASIVYNSVNTLVVQKCGSFYQFYFFFLKCGKVPNTFLKGGAAVTHRISVTDQYLGSFVFT